MKTHALIHLQKTLLCSLTALSLSACGGTGMLPVPPAGGDGNYDLPLKLSQELECGNGSSLIYEINARGEFKFLASTEPAKPTFITRQLSAADIKALDDVLEQADLETKLKASQAVPADSPQTKECRAVDTLTLHTDSGDKAFDRNGRKFNHTEAYKTAFAAIRTKLEALQDKYAPKAGPPAPGNPVASYSYALPFKIVAEGECELGDYTHFELDSEGLLKIRDAADAPLRQRQLNASEKQEVLDLLAKLDIARLAVADQPVPADAPQTLECRTVHKLQIQVNGEARSFDQNGRTQTHSQAYRDAFNKLIEHLQGLGAAADPGVQYQYALPLKVRLDGECGLPDFTRFEITASGDFTWTREDWPTLAAGNPPTQSRKLSAAEQQQVSDRLNALNLLEDAAFSEAVPADAPQTKECRTVTVYDLTADGKTESLEGQGTRKFRHRKELLVKLSELQKLLYELSGQKAPEL